MRKIRYRARGTFGGGDFRGRLSYCSSSPSEVIFYKLEPITCRSLQTPELRIADFPEYAHYPRIAAVDVPFVCITDYSRDQDMGGPKYVIYVQKAGAYISNDGWVSL